MQNNRIILLGTTASMMYQFRQDLIQLLIANGWSVYTFVCEYKEEELSMLQSIGAIPVTYKMKRGGLNPFSDILATLSLSKKIREIEPNIVFSFFTKPVIFGSIAAKMAKAPKITGMLEGLGTPFTQQKEKEKLKIKLIRNVQVFLYKCVFPFLDKLIFLNPDDPKDLVDKYKIKTKKNAVQILGAIGLNLKNYPYSPWEETPSLSFIFIARLIADKGIFEYVDAAKIVKQKYPNIKFIVIGGLDTENPHGLKEYQLNKLITDNVIEYSGFVTDVPHYIQKSAVFVLPSYREGVPRSTQEAMSIGRPVITTDVPGCRETVIDGINGFLVPKWNPEILAEKMIYFIENPEQVNIMGQESFKMAVEKFDAHKVNKKLCSMLGIRIEDL